MNGEEPFIEQIRNNVPNAEEVKNSVALSVNNVSDYINETKNGIQDSISEFSNTNIVEASGDFLNSNSLLAKFCFIIIIVIIFVILLKLCVNVIGYFFAPSSNPFIIQGTLNGNDRVVVYQDPKKSGAVTVLKSNDRLKGAEFTWSVWLFLNTSTDNKVKNIFVKGDANYASDGINLTNGPGMYVQSQDISGSTTNEYSMTVVMDHIDSDEQTKSNSRNKVVINNIPIQRWVHVAVRLQNTLLDVYVNGIISKRENMEFAPKQNFNDITVCGNGGFQGKLSNLRYYSYALNVFEINNIVMFGPNLTASIASIDIKSQSGTYSYLSNIWYSEKK